MLKEKEIKYEPQHEFESCNQQLDFEKCPCSQEELRTILFEQSENDGYLLG